MPAVLVERADGIAAVRLNRPQRLNAINQDVRHELPPALAALNADPGVRALVLAGAAAGAGYQLALYCDLRVAHPEAKIGQPEVKTGLASILGTSLMRWHLPFGMNAELSLLGDFISGERAAQLGLINRLVPRGEVMATAIELARALGARPPNALRLTKAHMRELTQAAFDDILVAARRYQRLAYEAGEPQRLFKELSKGKGS